MTPLRCAVYTRKSTEDGLEQEFNSLDAQREACEAYILSQHQEGWTLDSGRYDDGGISGGTMARAGLQALLAEVDAGRIQVIVVYKVDRLTRSLADFAKIVEVLDARGASFVSVTQAFNTTTSMGRLTLNVLLSFAQFEREVTGERIRDKIAASKKKGIWMGGPVPLGYRVEERHLVPVPEEAERVRYIMHAYLEEPSARVLIERLRREGVVTKVQQRVSGPHRGGIPFARGSLYHLLKNPIYRGMIVHKGTAYPGEHVPIVEAELFEAVQVKLAAQAPQRKATNNARHAPLLRGLLFDGHGRAMPVTHANKRGVRYRYYASRKAPSDDQPVVRVAAEKLDKAVRKTVAAFLADRDRLQRELDYSSASELQEQLHQCEKLAADLEAGQGSPAAGDLIERVTYLGGTAEIAIAAARIGTREPLTLTTEPLARRWSREPKLSFGTTSAPPIAAKAAVLGQLLSRAIEVREAAIANPELTPHQLGKRLRMDRRTVSRMIRLSYLSPRIVEGILEGEPPHGLDRKRLLGAELPLCWKEQAEMVGL
jgi:DNA invertase Pin-like site-specific DNA recombinase|tara:strand:- start:1190 stop:2812 length:1623 start_codon:yes stop_codon:yes gene_type:complete